MAAIGCKSDGAAGKNSVLRAFVSVTPNLAREGACAADERLNAANSGTSAVAARLSPVDGMAIAVKDNFCLRGHPTTCASRMLANFVAPYDATVVERLRAGGAVLVGKTNMDEFGMGSASMNSFFGAVKNPLNIEHVAGGSSGGSAAAVAAGMCVAAIGSDTGGSVRQPASFCGLVGVKPAYGAVSRHGLVSYASSLDTPGVIARTVDDAMDVLGVIAGADANDATCWVQCSGTEKDNGDAPATSTFEKQEKEEMEAAVANSMTRAYNTHSLDGIKVGLVSETFLEELPDFARENWQRGVDSLISLGATVGEVSIPSSRAALPAYYIIAPAEAASNLSRYDGVRYGHRASVDDIDTHNLDLESNAAALLHEMYAQTRSEGFGEEVQRRLLSGNFVLSSEAFDDYYKRALLVRARLRREFAENAFDQGIDVLVGPTTLGAAPRLTDLETLTPAQIYASDALTVPASLAGLPAMSVPHGVDPVTGLPLGLQLIGQVERERWREGGCSDAMVRCGRALAGGA